MGILVFAIFLVVSVFFVTYARRADALSRGIMQAKNNFDIKLKSANDSLNKLGDKTFMIIWNIVSTILAIAIGVFVIYKFSKFAYYIIFVF